MLIAVALALAAAGAAILFSLHRRAPPDDLAPPDPAKWRTAIHESGHVLVAWHMPAVTDVGSATTEPPEGIPGLKGVTEILYRSRAIGTREGIRQMIIVLMAGGAAESVILGDNTLAQTMDFFQAAELALLHQLGIDPRATPGLSRDEMNSLLRGLDAAGEPIREQVDLLLAACYAEAAFFLFERRDLLRALAEKLHRKGTIRTKDIQKILGGRRV